MDVIYSSENFNRIIETLEAIQKKFLKVDYSLSYKSGEVFSGRFGKVWWNYYISHLEYSPVAENLRKELEIASKRFSELSSNKILNFYNSIPKFQKNLGGLNQLNTIDFNSITSNIKEIRKLLDLAYQASKLEYKDSINEENDQNINNSFSSLRELEEAFEEHIKNPIGFQEKVANWTEQMKKLPEKGAKIIITKLSL